MAQRKSPHNVHANYHLDHQECGRVTRRRCAQIVFHHSYTWPTRYISAQQLWHKFRSKVRSMCVCVCEHVLGTPCLTLNSGLQRKAQNQWKIHWSQETSERHPQNKRTESTEQWKYTNKIVIWVGKSLTHNLWPNSELNVYFDVVCPDLLPDNDQLLCYLRRPKWISNGWMECRNCKAIFKDRKTARCGVYVYVCNCHEKLKIIHCTACFDIRLAHLNCVKYSNTL